ncbi:MAG: hypothetical protein ACI35R_09710 [Bacillus sp. (in: firmicutes)]
MRKMMNVLKKAKVFYVILLVVALGCGFAARGYFVQQENAKESKEYKQQIKEQQALIDEERKKNEELKSKMAKAEAKVTEITANITKAKDEHETNKANAVKNTTYEPPAEATKDTVLDFIRNQTSWGSETASYRSISFDLYFKDEFNGEVESSNLLEGGTAVHYFSVVDNAPDEVTLNVISVLNTENKNDHSITIRKGKDGKTIDVTDRGSTYNLEPVYYDL